MSPKWKEFGPKTSHGHDHIAIYKTDYARKQAVVATISRLDASQSMKGKLWSRPHRELAMQVSSWF